MRAAAGETAHKRRGPAPRTGLRPDRAGLDQARCQGQLGQVGAAAAAGLVPDPVQVRGHSADAGAQLGGAIWALVRPRATW